jgi:AcrR family transcriptional regulator
MFSVAPLSGAMSTPDFAALVQELGDHAEQPPDTVTDTKILDATLWLLGEIGERRLTIDDISATSRVARSTIFRRFGSKEALLQRLYQREVRKAVTHVLDVARAAPDAVAAIVAGYVALVDYTTQNPVINRQSRVEPEVQVRLWREGEIRGFDFITALIRGLGHGHDGADRIDHEALALLAALLARVFFAEIMLPGEQAGAWSATARARDLATLIELRLRAR